MPTAPLQTAGPFIGSHWNARTSTDLPPLSFIKDPLDDGDGGTVLQMEYPKGSYSGTNTGGVGNLQLGVFAPGQNRAIMSYEVRFALSVGDIWMFSTARLLHLAYRLASVEVSTLSKAENSLAFSAATSTHTARVAKTARRASPSAVSFPLPGISRTQRADAKGALQ